MSLFQKSAKKLQEEKEAAAKKRIFDQAYQIAETAYKKEQEYEKLTHSDLNYAIIEDLIKAARLTGTVTIELLGPTGDKSKPSAIFTIISNDGDIITDKLDQASRDLF